MSIDDFKFDESFHVKVPKQKENKSRKAILKLIEVLYTFNKDIAYDREDKEKKNLVFKWDVLKGLTSYVTYVSNIPCDISLSDIWNIATRLKFAAVNLDIGSGSLAMYNGDLKAPEQNQKVEERTVEYKDHVKIVERSVISQLKPFHYTFINYIIHHFVHVFFQNIDTCIFTVQSSDEHLDFNIGNMNPDSKINVFAAYSIFIRSGIDEKWAVEDIVFGCEDKSLTFKIRKVIKKRKPQYIGSGGTDEDQDTNKKFKFSDKE
jgi:hypothetical protein